ncbi:MAG: DUF1659 domain-containing protein [Syntrophomonadaceae bacterium]|nr:DUF1659 domain-containing protein [Syntrophomonadaceae bacterium]
MPVNTIPVATDLILVLDNGIGSSGQQLTQNRVYKNIKTDANNDKIYSVAETLAGLQNKRKLAIQRRDIVEIELT